MKKLTTLIALGCMTVLAQPGLGCDDAKMAAKPVESHCQTAKTAYTVAAKSCGIEEAMHALAAALESMDDQAAVRMHVLSAVKHLTQLKPEAGRAMFAAYAGGSCSTKQAVATGSSCSSGKGVVASVSSSTCSSAKPAVANVKTGSCSSGKGVVANVSSSTCSSAKPAIANVKTGSCSSSKGVVANVSSGTCSSAKPAVANVKTGSCSSGKNVVANASSSTCSSAKPAVANVKTGSCSSSKGVVANVSTTGACQSKGQTIAAKLTGACDPADCDPSKCDPAKCGMKGVVANVTPTGACQSKGQTIAAKLTGACDPADCDPSKCDPAKCDMKGVVAKVNQSGSCDAGTAKYVAFGCDKSDAIARAAAAGYLDVVFAMKKASGAEGCPIDAARQILASVVTEMESGQRTAANAADTHAVAFGAFSETKTRGACCAGDKK